MIATVEGRVSAKTHDALVVTVGGIGLLVSCPQTVLASARVNEAILLYTHLIVREDELALVGFASQEEKTLFEQLITVPGIGPRLGLYLLSAMAPDSLRMAIGQEQPDMLARVPGIGNKTAHKIVL